MSDAEQLELVKPSRYITSRAFAQHVNGVTIQWRAGQIVDREDLIRDLLAMGAPVTEITDEDDIGTCPHCGQSFSLRVQKSARELLSRAKMLMPGYK